MSFEMKARPDTGENFFRISGSRSAFLSSGVTKARFKVLQNSPDERERLTMKTREIDACVLTEISTKTRQPQDWR